MFLNSATAQRRNVRVVFGAMTLSSHMTDGCIACSATRLPDKQLCAGCTAAVAKIIED